MNMLSWQRSVSRRCQPFCRRGALVAGVVIAAVIGGPPDRAHAQPSAPPASDAATASKPCCVRLFGVSVADHALALPPTRPSFTLAFPVDLGRRILWDGAYLLTAPLRWETREWVELSLFVGGTGAALGLDGPISEASLDQPRSTTEADVENAIEQFGELPGIAGVLGGGLALGIVLQNERLVSQTITVGEALVFTALLVTSTKAITGRERPSQNLGPWAWFQGGQSFPSGHTSTAFALATGLSAFADDSLWAAIPAYALATGVGVARVRANAHFLSDVIVGAVVGVVTTRSMLWLEDQRRERGAHDAVALTVVPLIDADRRGVGLVLRF